MASEPQPEDQTVISLRTGGIFASTDLEEQLRERGIRRLIVCGIATNVCVTNMVRTITPVCRMAPH